MEEFPKEVQAAKEKGGVLMLTGEGGERYFFKEPGKQDLNRYLASAAKGKVATAVNNMVMALAVHPDAEALKRTFAEKPGRMVAINNALQNAIGLNEDFAVKKL